MCMSICAFIILLSTSAYSCLDLIEMGSLSQFSSDLCPSDVHTQKMS